VTELERLVIHLKTCEYKVCHKCGRRDTTEDGHNCIDVLKTANNELKQLAQNLDNNYKRLENDKNLLTQKNTELETKCQELQNKCEEYEGICELDVI
jgi:hypothetical protein